MSRTAPKDLPGPGDYPVLPPDMDYLYFEGAEHHPFEPDQTGYSPVNAWWLAEAAFLAYTHPGFARMAYRLAGFDEFRFFSGPTTECMVSWNRTAGIVAFRGTEMRSLSTLREIATDLDTVPVDFVEGGRVHRGFSRALEEVWEDGCRDLIEGLLEDRPVRPVWLTGHSLGGALATLAYSRLPDATGLYVFGCPRVGNQEFAALLEGRPVWRVEHGRDPIVLIPPDAPKLGLHFVPAGEVAHLTADGALRFERELFNPDKARSEAREKLSNQWKKLTRIFKRTKQALSKDRAGNKLSHYMAGTRAAVRVADRHIQSSLKEWQDYFADLDRATALKLEDHMPIYYAGKLWNRLVGSETRSGTGEERSPQ